LQSIIRRSRRADGSNPGRLARRTPATGLGPFRPILQASSISFTPFSA